MARGVLPWPNLTPDYFRGEDRVFVPNPDTAPAVAEPFRMRAEGATVKEVGEFLRSRSVKCSFHSVGSLLFSRVVLAKIVFGELTNPTRMSRSWTR